MGRSKMAISVSRVVGIIALLCAAGANVSVAQDVELDDCLGPGSQMCTVSPAILVEDSCGSASYRFNGRIAWPPLKNAGPVTISVKTRIVDRFATTFPMYVELGTLGLNDSSVCITGRSSPLLLAVQDGRTCGGTWTSIGPINLEDYGVPQGEFYLIKCVFFETIANPLGQTLFSPGLSCIRVEANSRTYVQSMSWTHAKRLYH